MIFSFQPNSQQNQVFNPTLDGNTFVAVIEWNVFGQRWYLRLSDTNGNLVVYKAVVSSADPLPLASLSWSRGVATAATMQPLGLSVGGQVKLLLSGSTPASYNGVVLATVTGPSSFTFELGADPGALVQLGSYGGFVDLTAGLFQESVFLYLASASAFLVLP